MDSSMWSYNDRLFFLPEKIVLGAVLLSRQCYIDVKFLTKKQVLGVNCIKELTMED